MRRRRFLAAAGTGLLSSIGGCLDEEPDQPSGADGSSDGADGGDAEGDTPGGGSGNGSEPRNGESEDGTGEREPIETDWPWGAYADREAIDLYVESPTGEVLGGVRAALARTGDELELGLSDAESMPEEGGMLFVFDEPRTLTFVMRRMDFGLDMVFADADGTITTIHHAPEPGPDEDGSEQEYTGDGQYVLEVNYEWTKRHGVEEGDVIEFELPTDG